MSFSSRSDHLSTGQIRFIDRLNVAFETCYKQGVKKKRSQSSTTSSNRKVRPLASADLLADVRGLIDASRQLISQAVNSGLVLLYWAVGQRIRNEILGQERATYGQQILQTLSEELTSEYGRGFGITNLNLMVRFAEVFPNKQLVETLALQLGWSHVVELLAIEESLKRDFYAEMCRLERWSVRTLRARIAGLLFERTAIARKPEEVARAEIARLRDEDRLSPDLVFRDPYVLDFLRLQDYYREEDVENAILRELEAFLLELGGDFSFVARQKRMTVDREDYFLDLLFFHRRLRRLVAIELKLGKFQAADKGQMELYLRWLDRHSRCPGEESPIGLILCAAKSSEHVELLELEASGIRVAQYLTELPPRPLLQRKLHVAITAARNRIK